MTDSPTQRTLIVDDDQPTREVLRMILEDAGYAVQEARTAEEALEQLRGAAERLVALVDHLMPGMDGLQALHAIEHDSNLADSHAYILITADVRPLSTEDIATLAALHCPIIRKPFDLDTLLSIMEQQASRLRSV